MIRIKVLLIDDQPFNFKLMESMIKRANVDYPLSIFSFADPREALRFLEENHVDIVISDLMMPGISGKELLLYLRENKKLEGTLFVIVSAFDERERVKECIELGATDFIRKPLDEFEFLPKIKNLVRLSAYMKFQKDKLLLLQAEIERATENIRRREYEMVNRLARVAEERDTDTGNHIIRVGKYSRIIVEKAIDDEEFHEMMELAAPLHDVGKIAIPDHILFKPGKLTPEEWKVMKTHTIHGYKILEGSGIKLLDLAAKIALYHHEKWNGGGYPYGIRGEDIPLSARVVAIADVFDALTMKRPYKDPWPLDKAFDLISSERGKHFDPDLAEIFLSAEKEIRKVYENYWEAKDYEG